MGYTITLVEDDALILELITNFLLLYWILNWEE